jgi:hypothetical protein
MWALGFLVLDRGSGSFWLDRGRGMQDSAYGLLRILLLRTRVNKGKGKGLGPPS